MVAFVILVVVVMVVVVMVVVIVTTSIIIQLELAIGRVTSVKTSSMV